MPIRSNNDNTVLAEQGLSRRVPAGGATVGTLVAADDDVEI
jgi:hypothetical protein